MVILKTVLKEIKRELQEKEKVRETAQKDMRKAASLSKQAILLIHQNRLKEARKLAERAKQILSKLDCLSATHPNIIYGGMLSASLQEYAEAKIFLALVGELRFVTPSEIDVPSVDYVLGLADVIGELRRRALDALREGDPRKGEECLRLMDEIYIELMAMDESYMLVAGLRRKCDVARKIIEVTRGDVTQEMRRSQLEAYLRRFEKQAKKRR